MASLLMYMKGLKTKERYAFPFGSYGWSTIGFKEFEEFLKSAGFNLPEKGAYIKFVPDSSELDELSCVVDFIQSKIS